MSSKTMIFETLPGLWKRLGERHRGLVVDASKNAKQIQLWTALRKLNFNKNELYHNTFYEIKKHHSVLFAITPYVGIIS